MINTELNYSIYNKEMLTIVSSFQYWYIYFKKLLDRIQIISDYKILEYFITIKTLTVQQTHWSEILSQFNFQIIYKPETTNCTDAFIKRKQNLDNQTAVKTDLQTQTLFKPK
jgi:hypothetical protein